MMTTSKNHHLNEFSIALLLVTGCGPALPIFASGSGFIAPVQKPDRIEPGARFQQRLKEARTRLGLTDRQVEQVRPILRAGFEDRLEVLQKHGIDIGSRPGTSRQLGFRELRRLRRGLDAVRKRTLENLDAVLSEAQLKTYKQIQEENRKALRERLRQRRR